MALPLLIGIVLKAPPLIFAAFISLCSFLGLSEFYRMSLPGRKIAGVVAALAGGCMPLLFPFRTNDLFFLALTVTILACAVFFLFSIEDIRKAGGEFALLVAGFLYVPFLLGHLVLVRELPHGIPWIFFMMVLVMSGDSAAYYVGSALGKHKLYPVVSPNKSVEGALGGLAGSLLGAFICRLTFFPELSVMDCVLTVLVIGPLGQVGDLFESLLKRSFGVKDSGTIIPGHGGMLDRLDSILFATPAIYYYARYAFAG